MVCRILIAKVRISERRAKEKLFFLLLFRAKVPSAQPKVRISEQRAKEKLFLLLPFRAKVPSANQHVQINH
jgi:hypothetical protein